METGGLKRSFFKVCIILIAYALVSDWGSKSDAAVGCMSRYKGIKQQRQFGFIKCACPCNQSTRTFGRDYCFDCGHSRKADNLIVIDAKPKKSWWNFKIGRNHKTRDHVVTNIVQKIIRKNVGKH